jgi:hypothetical protein
MPAPTPYHHAYLYLLGLCQGTAHLIEQKALASTAVCEAHRRGLEDTRRSWHWQGHTPIDITILRAA